MVQLPPPRDEESDSLLSERQFGLFQELVQKRLGFQLAVQKRKRFCEKISERMKALRLREPLDYYDQLLWSGNRQTELEHLAELLANHETYFLREPRQLLALFLELAPSLQVELRPSRAIRVLSLGCSTGEEAYSLALLERYYRAERLGPSLEIVGADLCESVLAQAREGIYGGSSFRRLAPESRAGLRLPDLSLLQSRYFDGLPDGRYQVREPIRRSLDFRQINLLKSAQMLSLGTFDIVLCRNVFIYFDEDSLQNGLENIASILEPDGLLILGQSETLLGRKSSFSPHPTEQGYVYRVGQT